MCIRDSYKGGTVEVNRIGSTAVVVAEINHRACCDAHITGDRALAYAEAFNNQRNHVIAGLCVSMNRVVII